LLSDICVVVTDHRGDDIEEGRHRHTSDMDRPLQLSGGTISLRDINGTDQIAIASLAHDEAMFEFMKFRIDAAWLARRLPEFLEEPALGSGRRRFSLAVVSGDDFIGLAMIGEATEDGEAELGWYLRSDSWGRGYATQVAGLLLTFGFDELGLRRMVATADPENGASIRVLTKSGFRDEGPTDPVETWRGRRPRQLFSADRRRQGAGYQSGRPEG
jgi:RimJ/RimL family protein N-acetyltransferase